MVMLSWRSERKPVADGARSSWECWDEGIEAASAEVMEEAGERREEEVELVVLLRERPLKTERRLGEWAWAVERERIWTECSGGSDEAPVEGRSWSWAMERREDRR